MKKILITLLLSTILFTSFSQEIDYSDAVTCTFILVKEVQQCDGVEFVDPKGFLTLYYRIDKKGKKILVGKRSMNYIFWDKNYLLSNKKVKLKYH